VGGVIALLGNPLAFEEQHDWRGSILGVIVTRAGRRAVVFSVHAPHER
jgi:hypothetical protein